MRSTRIDEAVSQSSLEDFKQNWVIQDAIIRELQIVGEAAGRVSKQLVTSHPEFPWREITGLRHKLVHDYFVVDLEVVWRTATADIPAVRPGIVTLLDEVTG